MEQQLSITFALYKCHKSYGLPSLGTMQSSVLFGTLASIDMVVSSYSNDTADTTSTSRQTTLYQSPIQYFETRPM